MLSVEKESWIAGIVGDQINVMLAAAVYNFKRVINQVLKGNLSFLFDFLNRLFTCSVQPVSFELSKMTF